MINPIDLKKGTVIKLDGDLYSVSFSQFVNPGKGSAFVRTKLKHLQKGNVIERTFKSNEKLDDVELEKRYMQYLYPEDDHIVFMDRDDYEQISIPKDLIEDLIPFMKEEMPVEVTFFEGNPMGVIPPTFVELEVTYAEEGLKGDTVGTARKRVTIETGGEVQVPLYINQGDTVKIDLRDFSFVERVSK
ncbi:MAG: elongation factor P [Leptospiraceae bacterium]|nr:elongation factor P [Leptospiraceae bacterium]MCB1320883.1 elongation factor P [Leptospiraceae bacterium]